jgi:hypothetical protein
MNPQPTSPLRTTHDRREDLTVGEVLEMRRLLERHFDGVDARQFAADLAEKSHVLRVWQGDALVGFSTLLAYRETVNGEALNLLYSGDTIMSPECWHSPALSRGWIAMVLDLQSSMPPGRCYWLLLSAGFRTYRFLPVFWRVFWPRFDEEMPDEIRRLRDAICRERFGEQYNAGVVRFSMPHQLRGNLAEVPDARRNDPHVAYFLSQNPGWQSGDELVCLTEIHDANLTPAGRRMIRPCQP